MQAANDMYHLLSSVGVPAKVHGWRYLIKAADIMIRDEDAAFAMTKQVYMRVADNYGISHKQVENAMRIAIEHAWKMGRCDRHELIFGYSRLDGKRPSNSEFLIRIIEFFKASDKLE